MVFYPYEQILIYTWTQEYEELITFMKKINSTNSSDYQHQIKPLNDLLFDKLIEKSMESKFTIENSVHNSIQSNEDKDFIILLFNYILSLKTEKVITQDKLNIMADAFLIKYPSSNFVDFTRTQIRYKFVASKWGLTLDFFSGFCSLTKDLSNKFTNPIPFGVAFDIKYEDIVIYLRDFIAITKTKKDIQIKNTTWNKNKNSLFVLPEASIGYIFINNKYMSLAPFMGLSSANFDPNQTDKAKQENEIKGYDFTTTYTFGLNLDYKMIKKEKLIHHYMIKRIIGL